jgi:hypothetical protein
VDLEPEGSRHEWTRGTHSSEGFESIREPTGEVMEGFNPDLFKEP